MNLKLVYNMAARIRKSAAQIICAVLPFYTATVKASLVVLTASQTGAVPFTPSWIPSADSLISGLAPSSYAGNFDMESQGGDRNVNSLTAGGSLTIQTVGAGNTTCSSNYVTGGNAGGTSLVYTLPASTNGYNLTNITVYGGWQDNGRDQQAYTVYYSTIAAPTTFTLLTSVNYNPSVPGGIASATQVTIADSSGSYIATNVAAVMFDFTTPTSENGYTGYGAITMGGTLAANTFSAPYIITTSNQFSSSPFTPTWVIENDSLINGQAPQLSRDGQFFL